MRFGFLEKFSYGFYVVCLLTLHCRGAMDCHWYSVNAKNILLSAAKIALGNNKETLNCKDLTTLDTACNRGSTNSNQWKRETKNATNSKALIPSCPAPSLNARTPKHKQNRKKHKYPHQPESRPADVKVMLP